MPRHTRSSTKNDRQSVSLTSHYQPMKKNGNGKFNYGSAADDVHSFFEDGDFSPKTGSYKPDSKVEVVNEAEFFKTRMTARTIKKNDRQSLGRSSYSQPMKKNGSGKFNFGKPQDDVFDFYSTLGGGTGLYVALKQAQAIGDNKLRVVGEDEFFGK
ncbi:hypothetical protein HK100_002279 [Physocladia obscura]|uniref:Uncharacterized protein n=1 Tax=Physocladia obscura TaxID=109957 RepID=A0AAD5SYR3_9FUNG|nr:hypothetical protein HK100_002279 [Physocladia obscura]